MLSLKLYLTVSFLSVSLWSVDVVERDADTGEMIIYGSEASDRPTGGTLHNLQPQTLTAFQNTDLSDYPNAHIYFGYGVYDKENRQCMNIDAPAADGSSVESAFVDFNVYNGHSYGISFSAMPFAQCQSLASKYSGYPAMITTSEENNALAGYYPEHSFWISTHRASCSDLYLDARGREQQFFKWPNGGVICDSIRLNAVQGLGVSSWTPVNGNENHFCVVEFESPDYTKPIKSCAPWWTVEREYPIPARNRYTVTGRDKNGDPMAFDVRSIHQKDIPRNVEVCTKRSGTELTQVATQEVVCNSYYSINRSPRCAIDIKQELCEVNECQGTIQNSCTLIESQPAPLQYAKQLVLNEYGEEKWVRGKEEIMMHKYECPVYTGGNGCLSSSIVSILPQPCPGTDVDAEGNETRPIRVYGDPGIPGKYDGDGNIVAMYGRCPNGDLVEIPVDLYRQNSKKCLDYAQITENRSRDEVCTLSRSYADYTVGSGITEPDAFVDNNDCIRLNSVDDARPDQELIISYDLRGFADMAIVKATIDGDIVDNSPTPLGSYYMQQVLAGGNYGDEVIEGPSVDEQLASYDLSAVHTPDCTLWQDGAFRTYLETLKNLGVRNSYDTPYGELLWLGDRLKLQCETAADSIGATILYGANDLNATEVAARDAILEATYGISVTGLDSGDILQESDGNFTTDGCLLNYIHPVVSGDAFNQLKFNATGSSASLDIEMKTPGVMDYLGCRDLAACTFSDIQNTSLYSGSEICRLSATENSGDDAWDEIKAEVNAEIAAQAAASQAEPETAEEAIVFSQTSTTLNPDSIDGLGSVYALIEYTHGSSGLGYFSNYSSRNYECNVVNINGKVAHPLRSHPLIDEDLFEDYWFSGHTYINASVHSTVATSIGMGAGGGIDTYDGATYMMAAFTGGVSFVTGYVVSVLSGGQKCFDMHVKSTVYDPLDPNAYHYVANPVVPYETRKLGISPTSNDAAVIYNEYDYATKNGCLPKSAQSKFFEALKETKTVSYKEMNINMDSYDWPEWERTMGRGYPHRDVWKPWEKRSKSYSGGWGTLEHPKYHRRKVSVHWLDATNAVTVVLPYRGDYEFEAYNKYGDLLASTIVYSTAFTSTGQSLKWTPVNLGTAMVTTAPGVSSNGACFDDPMVEVGGGVSGAYYELGETGYHSGFACDQSNFNYVKENAITAIKVRATSSMQKFSIKLPKPLTLINRIFAVNLDQTEEKIYRCYDPFNDDLCTEFTEAGGE